uniref:Uncharacterized protein n=1 Tax=Trichogramma kaykai TaxID=54128 RepID=A0ABD2WG31_9HYME
MDFEFNEALHAYIGTLFCTHTFSYFFFPHTSSRTLLLFIFTAILARRCAACIVQHRVQAVVTAAAAGAKLSAKAAHAAAEVVMPFSAVMPVAGRLWRDALTLS